MIKNLNVAAIVACVQFSVPVSHPNIWMAYNLQAFCFDLHVYSTLRLGATGAHANIQPSGSACKRAVFDSHLLPAWKSCHHKMFRTRRFSTQTLDIEPYISILCLAWNNRAAQKYSLETHGHLGTSADRTRYPQVPLCACVFQEVGGSA